MVSKKITLASDYLEGCHPNILRRLEATNAEKHSGYGEDDISESARNRIRKICQCPKAEVRFLIGGTQANATVIDAFLFAYQGVIAADTGHIAIHEAGAIEFGGHKVITLSGTDGKIKASQVQAYCKAFASDASKDHEVMPGMVYLSQPTEYGTLYSLRELTALSKVCHQYHLSLFVDGSRLAYALGSEANDVSLAAMAHLCDVFSIGGTKCGALFGEAVVIPDSQRVPHFFTIIKQHGALLAKGWIAGIQFDELFKGKLYDRIGKQAVQKADRIRNFLIKKGFTLLFDSPTNQIFLLLENERFQELSQKIDFSVWSHPDSRHTLVRLATSWATTEQDVQEFLDVF